MKNHKIAEFFNLLIVIMLATVIVIHEQRVDWLTKLEAAQGEI